MSPGPGRTAFLVTSYPGQRGVAELRRQAEAGALPRRDYVELASRFPVDVIDTEYLATRATAVGRWLATRGGIPVAQVCEALLRGAAYDSVWAWSDRTGLPLALVRKLTGSRRDLVLVSAWLSRPKKAVFLRPLGVHSHIRAIVSSSRAQLDIAADRLSVPADKLHFAPWPVDDRFWTPQSRRPDNVICSVGMEARDYSTLLEAVRDSDLDVDVTVAVGTVVFSAGVLARDDTGGPDPFGLLRRTFGYRFYRRWTEELAGPGLPGNVSVLQQLDPVQLRDLYARSRFVVVPLQDVDSDNGITTITEAMAMGKAVIVSRSRGQVDVIEDGKQGIYVPPYEAGALRSAIQHLLAHPEEAARMGREGRALVERRHALDLHLERIAALMEAGTAPVAASPSAHPA